MTEIGSNTFNCPIPLVFKNRYFILEQVDNQDIFSVFTVHDGELIFELFQNEVQENPLTEVSKTAPGFISFSEKDSGRFLFKIRPEYNGSSIFGKIGDAETEIKITDRAIIINTNTFQNNRISAAVGILVSEDGSIGVGAPIPEEARHLFIR